MSSGAKQLVQFVPETTVATTPTPFNRTTLKFTEISLDATVNKTDSNSIADTRISQGTIITSAEYAGDLTTEAQFGAYDQLIAAAAFNDWSGDSLTFGGDLRQTFTVLRGFKDINDFHVFRGVHINTFALDIPEDGQITMTFGLMALGRTKLTSAPAGAITPAINNKSMSNVTVGNILIDGVSQQGVSCITAFNFNWDNSMQVQRCLGNGVDPQKLIETVAAGTGSFTAAWSANTSAMYEKQFTNASIALVVPISDPDGNNYTLTLPEVEITASLPSGGNSDILSASFDYVVRNQAPILTRDPV